MGLHIGVNWRIRWNNLRGSGDAGCRYHYCDNLLIYISFSSYDEWWLV